MNFLSEKDIYFHTQIKRRVSLNPRFLDENFPSTIEKIVKRNIEGKCIKEGYVVPKSVIILKRSMGNLNTNQFNGNILFDVIIGAKVCNIPVNSVIKAKAKKINNLGILAELGPLMIIVPKEIHNQKDPFKDVKPGMDLELLVVGKTFDLNSKVISVYAKLNSEAKKKIMVPVRKGADKHKNTDQLVANETIMPEEANFADTSKESQEWMVRFEESEGSELEDEDIEGSIEDESEFEEELDESGEAGELDTEIIDDEESLENAEELVAEENEPLSEDTEEEEEEEDEDDDEEDEDEGDLDED